MNARASHILAAVLFSAGQVIQFLKTNPDLAGAIHITSTVLTFAAFVVALASTQLFGTPTPPAPTPPSSAAVKIAGAAMLALTLVFGLGANCQAPTVSPGVQTDISGGLELAACVEGVYARDSQQTPKPSPGQIAIDEGIACGADVANLIKLFGKSQDVGRLAVAGAALDNAQAVHTAAMSFRADAGVAP